MNRVLILHYHEIWLKGGNKNYFLSRLTGAVKRSLADLPVQSIHVLSDRLLLYPLEDSALPLILERLCRVFGLAYIAPARVAENNIAAMGRMACEMMAEKNPQNFAVRAKIADSEFTMNSMELERELGRVVLDHLRSRRNDIQVKLNHPEVTCSVEVVPGRAFIYTDRVEGAGGLPPVTAGRLVALLSGGFDSAVAAYKMMRRGAHVTFVHFASSGSTGRGSSQPIAEEIVRTLTRCQFTSRLYIIPFEPVQRQVVVGAQEKFRVLLYRRMMARIAREITRVERALGLVTGDSVSQVASQTLHNLAAIDFGMDVPVYRPLAGDDKEEILRWARQIGTYKISCEPFEDCCPRFMPRAPAIFSNPAELTAAESTLDVEALLTMGLEGAIVHDFKFEAGKVTVRENLPRRFQKLLALRKGMPWPAAARHPVPAGL
ncbi:MAG TPA: tRNA uracil 4-sulfurtransferase ThiI [Terriglobia bacterium]|nr:tRNA uracil 4-sulfurtransferase ThiI [Terriglobia bacterium]